MQKLIPLLTERVDFEEARVDLSLNVRKVFSQRTIRELNECFDKVSQLYPQLVKEESLWKTNLENGNHEVHPAHY